LKISIGSDHAGYNHKSKIIELVNSLGHTAIDVGANSTKSVDYPDYGEKGAKLVACGKADMAILVCGTGIGISLAANKVRGIRAAVCWNTETAFLARQHNHANVLCLGARFLSEEECIKIVKVFINTPENSEERHARRVKKIMAIEERNKTCEKK